MDNNKALLSLCVLSVVLMSAVLVFKQTQPGNDDLIRDGKFWTTACSLKEVDIPTGMFTSNINRLDCSGVVVNVVTDKYDQAVSAYNKSKNQG